MDENPDIDQRCNKPFLHKLLYGSVWLLPVAIPALSLYVIAKFTPLLSCGCVMTQFAIIFVGAYVGIAIANVMRCDK